MRKNLILAIATLAIALAGCSKSEETPTESLNGEIRLSSGVTTLTRTSFGMDTQIASGQSVAVYVDNSSDAPIYGNNILTANGSGGLVAQGAQFIQIKLANGSDLFYKMETATTFESGKRYQYKITANLSGLTATSIVSDWMPVNPVTGNAEIE